MPLMIAIIRELPRIETKVEVVFMQILSLLPLLDSCKRLRGLLDTLVMSFLCFLPDLKATYFILFFL